VHDEFLSTDTGGLAEAQAPDDVHLADGETYAIEVRPVRKWIDDAGVRMLGYNGSIPGPTLHVRQHSALTIEATNNEDIETTLHWHGLRLENRFDGVPQETQAPIAPGGAFVYRLQFPDPGIYWYHPHIREDFAQEMGLYGAIIVEPADPDHWPPADRELALTLDDILIEDGRLAPFLRSGPTFTAMGRFGNVMLTNGETDYRLEAALGEVVRFHVVNTANTRFFNFAVGGGRMKLVGGDSGRVEREEFVNEVLLSPSERATVDIMFEEPGEAILEHRTPDKTYELGRVAISGDGRSDAGESFAQLRVDPELSRFREDLAPHLEREADKVLIFRSEMPLLYADEDHQASAYVCPMHPEVTASEPGTCPKCGMKLIPAESPREDQASEHQASEGHAHEHGGNGIEWEDLMPEINRQTNTDNMIWQVVDSESGAANQEITWAFRVGDRVKIRIRNEMDQDHPMPHPFHIHGAGRFVILARNGEPEPNLVWKDTVLVGTGETVDILLEVTNPGLWMAHCHIAEHIESGMMFSFEVAPAAQ
jgi:FtsP/CotA-like multicopper oxidase with cupredoxin domain